MKAILLAVLLVSLVRAQDSTAVIVTITQVKEPTLEDVRLIRSGETWVVELNDGTKRQIRAERIWSVTAGEKDVTHLYSELRLRAESIPTTIVLNNGSKISGVIIHDSQKYVWVRDRYGSTKQIGYTEIAAIRGDQPKGRGAYKTIDPNLSELGTIIGTAAIIVVVFYLFVVPRMLGGLG